MMKYLQSALFLFLVSAFGFSLAYASSTNGTIGPNDTVACTVANATTNHCTSVLIGDPSTTADDKYVNFGRYADSAVATVADVHVTSTALTGFAFGESIGWIVLNCANTTSGCSGINGNFKVANDGTGILSGYAWGENTGWVNFGPFTNSATPQVKINGTTGLFGGTSGTTGYAWTQNFGWLKFDCSAQGQLDGACVETDWRANGGSTTGSTGSSGSTVIIIIPPTTGTTTTGTTTGGTSGTTTTTGTSGTSSSSSTSSTGSTGTTTTGTSGTSSSSSTSSTGSTGTTTTGTTTGGTSGTTTTTGTSGTSSSSSTSSTGSTGTSSSSGGSGPIPLIGDGFLSLIQDVLGEFFNSFGELSKKPIIDLGAKVITGIGALAGVGMTLISTLSMNPFSFADFASLPLRLWSLLLAALGLRRKPWGTVYDAVTKQPLDPVYVVLNDANGKEVATSITDLDGRYGFLSKAGTYTLVAGKTNYKFPSETLRGRSADELYQDLYFGEPITVNSNSDVIAKNIPMDPIGFDWNEFAKKDQKLMSFYSGRAKFFSQMARVLYYVGFIISLAAVISTPRLFNIIIFGLYLLIFVLRRFGFTPKPQGGVMDFATKTVLPFAIMRVYSAATNTEITHKVTDATGRYYCLIQNGTYYASIEKKNPDGTYTKVYTSPQFQVTKGYIGAMFEV